MEHISTIKDPRIVLARELTSFVGRKKHNRCLLEGEQAIRWALHAGRPIEYVFVHDKSSDQKLFEQLHKNNISLLSVSEGVLKKITGTRHLISVIGVMKIKKNNNDAISGNIVLVLDHVQDHGNVGAIMRTASAFGINDIVLTQEDTDVWFKKIISASRGTVFNACIHSFSDDIKTIENLKKDGYQILATSPYGKQVQSLVDLKQKPLAIVVGNETDGVSKEIEQAADVLVNIPMASEVESLNVAVAAGISIYELKIRIILSMLTRYIKDTLGRNINVAGKLIQRAFDAQLSQVTDLDARQVILMMILQCDGVMTFDQAERDTALHGRLLNDLLDPLFVKKYLALVDEMSFTLTDEGKQVLAKLWAVVEKTEEKILHNFTDDEKEQLNDFVKRIQKNCEEIIENN